MPEMLSSTRSVQESATGRKQKIRVIYRDQAREGHGQIRYAAHEEANTWRNEAWCDEHYRGHQKHHDPALMGDDDSAVDNLVVSPGVPGKLTRKPRQAVSAAPCCAANHACRAPGEVLTNTRSGCLQTGRVPALAAEWRWGRMLPGEERPHSAQAARCHYRIGKEDVPNWPIEEMLLHETCDNVGHGSLFRWPFGSSGHY
jgi:hypothetical protein